MLAVEGATRRPVIGELCPRFDGVRRIAVLRGGGLGELMFVLPAAEALAGALEVTVRVDAELGDLDVAGFGRGAHPVRHCAQALDDIADLHRGEHVLVIAGTPAPGGETVLRQLEIGDDGWGPLG